MSHIEHRIGQTSRFTIKSSGVFILVIILAASFFVSRAALAANCTGQCLGGGSPADAQKIIDATVKNQELVCKSQKKIFKYETISTDDCKAIDFKRCLIITCEAEAIVTPTGEAPAAPGGVGAAESTSTGGAPAEAPAPQVQSTASDMCPNPSGVAFPCPLGRGASITTIAGRMLSWILGLVGALFFAMFIWGGVLYIIAGSDSKNAENGRKTMVNAVVGLFLIIFGYALLSFILGAISTAGG